MNELRAGLIKLASQEPALRAVLVPLLKQAAVEEVIEEDDAPEPAEKRKGPPPKWDEFLAEKYQGGKKKVPNPNYKTKGRYPQVSVVTAMRDPNTKTRIMREYSNWLKRQNQSPKKAPVEKSLPKKAPPQAKK